MRDWIETLHAVLAGLVLMAALHGLWWAYSDKPLPLTLSMLSGYTAYVLLNRMFHRHATAEINYLQALHDLPDHIDRGRGTS